MNGKKAKQLRAVAKANLSTVVEETSYVRKSLQKERVRFSTDASGNKVPTAFMATYVTIRLKEGCVRQVYKMLKKNYRESRGVYA